MDPPRPREPAAIGGHAGLEVRAGAGARGGLGGLSEAGAKVGLGPDPGVGFRAAA